MAYTAFYRKWRPMRFEDMRGQETVVRTLKNQLNTGRIGHAYLFAGTRGTGKTTAAKIFARAVNCEHPVNGSPCNECAVCRAILAGTSVNVVEIDAASNNGVDNIREIREEVRYKPTEGNYRVYIIDEVHMLSTGAFNALLKTLEEPPEYVIFILATTEIHRIPITVLSRCQRYDFKRLPLETLKDQLRDILREEKIEADESAIGFIARQADGSSRDGLSILEQCVSFYYGERLTYEKVLDALGASDQTVFSGLLRRIINRDISGTVMVVDDLLSTGRDLSQFVLDLTWYLRNVLLVQTEDPTEDTLGISRENLKLMKEEAEELDYRQVMRYIRILSELSNRMRFSGSKRVQLELALMKMMQPAMETDEESLLERIGQLEDRISQLSSGAVRIAAQPADMGSGQETAGALPQYAAMETQAAAGNTAKQTGGAGNTAPWEPAAGPRPVVEVSDAAFEDYQMLQKNWAALIGEQGRLFRALLQDTTLSLDGDEGLQVLFRDGFHYTAAVNSKRDQELKALLRDKYGKEFRVSLKLLKETEAAPQVVRGKRIPGIEMDIEE